jgi:hypothetical protein
MTPCPSRWPILLAFVAASTLACPARAQEDPPRAVEASATALGSDPRLADDAVVASAFDTSVTWKELEPVLVTRRALSKEGKDALHHLAKSRMLEVLAQEQGLEVPEAEVDARWAEVETQLAATGEKDGLEKHLKQARLTRAEFRHFLKLSIMHEILTRRALGKKDGEKVGEEQQELFLDETLHERGLELFPDGWTDGVVARAEGFTIEARPYLLFLRRSLSPTTLNEDVYQVLLRKRILQRMPDLAPDKLRQYVEEELTRRRAETANDPSKKGISWDKLLGAQGILVERMRDDPGVQIAALVRLWVERNYDETTLKRIYADERELFDAAYGPAIDVRMVFLRAADLPRDGDLRTFRDAEQRLVDLKQRIRGLEDFERAAKETSEDGQTREKGGDLGWVTLGNLRVPEAVRTVVKNELAARPVLAATSAGAMHGPVRLPNGMALLWLGARRGNPSWEQMRLYVQRELRERFVDDVLPRSKMVEVFQ